MIRRFGQTTFLNAFHYLREFTVDPALIRCPAPALVGAGEGGEPIATAEGADTHCQFGNLALSNAVTLDWLEDTLGKPAR